MDTLLTLFALVLSALPAQLAPMERDGSAINSRPRRSYFPFTASPIYAHKYEPISVYKPPMYALSRPYYVPVFGAPGRVPIYFPPQPLNIHFPDDDNSINKKPFKGPAYLPPAPPTTESGDKVNMTISNRFKDEDEEPAPIWGIVKTDPAAAPVGRPTRPPSSGQTTLPPLVHATVNKRPASQGNQIYFDNEAPSAVMLHVESEEDEKLYVPPVVAAPASTVAPPQAAQAPNEVKKDNSSPGPCVWAIISCCSAASDQIRYNCFEQRGCGGAFWGRSPCDSDLTQSAIAAALNYYNSK